MSSTYFQPHPGNIAPDYFYVVVENKIPKDFFIEELIKASAVAFHTSPASLREKCRYPNVKFARWIVWKVMTDHGYSLKTCGRMLGMHDHTTVINALSKIDADIENIQYVKAGWLNVKEFVSNNYPI